MTDVDAFMRSIIENPDDDAPRLVFADSLEENGDSERAEFIRLQIESEPLPEWDSRRELLIAREYELLKAHGHDWYPEMPESPRMHHRRGFVEILELSVLDFATHADSYFQR